MADAHTLITSDSVTIADLATLLGPHFDRVRVEQDHISLAIERLPADYANEIRIRDGDAHATILHKPSTWDVDYEGPERAFILALLPAPRTFIIRHTDDALLERLLLVLDRLGTTVLEDGYGNLRIWDRQRIERRSF